METFRSFIDNGGFEQSYADTPPPLLELLENEIISSQCDKCRLHSQFGENLVGTVFCTNVRLSFAPLGPPPQRAEISRSRTFDDLLDIPLISIYKIYFCVTSSPNGAGEFGGGVITKRKFKELTSSVSTMHIISSLKFVLKDMRVFTLDLSHSQNAANLANHALHFSRPSSATHVVQCGRVPSSSKRVPFKDSSEWYVELSRTGLGEKRRWRMLNMAKELLSHSVVTYPMYVVVPTEIVKHEIDMMIPLWKHGRFPVWTWAHPSGASILRSSFYDRVPNGEKLNSRYHQLVAAASPNQDPPFSMILDVDVFNTRNLASAFSKLTSICAIDSYTQLDEASKEWLSRLHDTGWPRLVSACLRHAAEGIDWLVERRRSIIIYEDEGRDFSAVVSALIQVCVDPYCRYSDGLLYLIAKEFSALGHPFGERLVGGDRREGVCPVLLLFLDCVHQLLKIYPTQFSYSQHTLIALWDLAISGLVPAFTCNSVSDQLAYNLKGDASPLTAFFNDEYTNLFGNVEADSLQAINSLVQKPKYKRSFSPEPAVSSSSIPATLRPPSSAVNYNFWTECFHRWIPPANVTGGGDINMLCATDSLTSRLVKGSEQNSVAWIPQYRLHPETERSIDDTRSSAFPYTGAELTHRNALNSSIHNQDKYYYETVDAISVSAMSMTESTATRMKEPKNKGLSRLESNFRKLSFKKPKTRDPPDS